MPTCVRIQATCCFMGWGGAAQAHPLCSSPSTPCPSATQPNPSSTHPTTNHPPPALHGNRRRVSAAHPPLSNVGGEVDGIGAGRYARAGVVVVDRLEDEGGGGGVVGGEVGGGGRGKGKVGHATLSPTHPSPIGPHAQVQTGVVNQEVSVPIVKLGDELLQVCVGGGNACPRLRYAVEHAVRGVELGRWVTEGGSTVVVVVGGGGETGSSVQVKHNQITAGTMLGPIAPPNRQASAPQPHHPAHTHPLWQAVSPCRSAVGACAPASAALDRRAHTPGWSSAFHR